MVNNISSIEDLDIEVDVPVEALETVDLELPSEYADEVFAQEVLDNIIGYHKSTTARKAALNQGNTEQAEQFGKQALICKAAAALIQHEHPNTKVIYKQIAVLQANRVKETRASLME